MLERLTRAAVRAGAAAWLALLPGCDRGPVDNAPAGVSPGGVSPGGGSTGGGSPAGGSPTAGTPATTPEVEPRDAAGDAAGDAADDGRDPEAIVTAILDRCHGARRGTFASLAVELRDAPDGPPTLVHAALPERIRVQSPTDTIAARNGEQGWLWPGGPPARPLTDGERDDLAALATLLGAVALLPLEQHTAVERTAPDRLALRTADGAVHTLAWDPARDAPLRLSSPAGEVVFLEFYDSGRTLVPTHVTLGPRGECWLRFLGTGVTHLPELFDAPPGTGSDGERVTFGPDLGQGAVREVDVRPVRWLWMPDPGDWKRRMELFRSAGRRLFPAGYGNGGDPMLIEDDAGAWFVVPFRPRLPDPEPVRPADGERLTELDAHRALQLVAESGADWAARIAKARAALDAALAQRGLRADGALCVGVNLVNRDPATDPGTLRDAVVTLSYRLVP
ncbi:MAG: hypothetical protein IPM29_23785 [Planctomycetes bacterium]|nr:hypothetical protein [Planctomycetota bacterium]